MREAIRDIRILKGQPRVLKARDDQRAADKQQRKVYALVDARDGKRCVCCGRRGNPYAVDALERIHRHHILQVGRDQGPMETWNLVSVCAICHSLIHITRELDVTGNADRRTLRWMLKRSAVADVFFGRAVPAHVRLVA